MKSQPEITPEFGESPACFADRIGEAYTSSVSQNHKKEFGQFFTPVEIARLMASFTGANQQHLKILDPGCGCCILSCALIEYLLQSNSKVKSIDLLAYETDLSLVTYALKSIDYLTHWGTEKGIQIKAKVLSEDFVLDNAEGFHEISDLFYNNNEQFDIVISNPPYFKLAIDDKRSLAAKVVVNGHPNIYAIFMALSARLLKPNGELIFITPRSYAAGSYFKVFRDYFFKLIDIDNVHLFNSRKETFERDKVLQETVIVKGTKRSTFKPNVIISSCSGIKDIHNPVTKSFPKNSIIDVNSKEKILFLPTSDEEEQIMEVFSQWNGSLSKFQLKVSTGPVVAFRARDLIKDHFENGAVVLAPLFWLHNIRQMAIEWPVIKPNKGQYIRITKNAKTLLIPNRNYIFIRRFSSKDDKNRLIASPHFSNESSSDLIGLENKVNYIYHVEGKFDKVLIYGLCALLNSSLFDHFFRIFNGNVNVSATELRNLPLPPIDAINQLGQFLIDKNDFSLDRINYMVNTMFIPNFSYEQN